MTLGRPMLLVALLGLSGLACEGASDPQGTATTEVDAPNTAPPPANPSCTVDGVVTERDVTYADPMARGRVDPSLVSLDLYRPVLPDGCPPSPIVVWVHGGGFNKGDKANQVEDKVRLFTAAGWVFASVNYRLAADPPVPGVQHPAQVEDLGAAVGWLAEHAADLGADAGSVAVVGHSAGAFLVTLLGTDASFLESAGVPFASLRCAVSLDTEGFDVSARVDAGGAQEAMYRNAFGDDPDVWAAASPQRIVEASLPGAPFPQFLLVVQGRTERLAGNHAFADALTAIGGSAEVVDANPLDHQGVNRAVGQDGDTVVTPPLVDFLGSCLAS